ncbi:MAG: complement resistance protein TraT, partial [Lentisphaeraceae bacterium]|nr:complement resistance protein TraT [Lentisphaeraceae bacterium]
MIKNFCISAMLIFITLFGQSCTSIMDPDAAELKTSLKQLNPRANIRPASEKDMLVYVRYRNSSGSVLDVKDSVMNEITQSGYRIVNDMDQAQYVMIADLRFVGQKSSDTYGHTVFGALLGAVAGAVIGHQIGGGTTEKVVGGGIGAVLGGLAGKAIDNRNRIVTVDMVVDIRIGERIKGGVTTNRAGDSN